jgi:hypothetical protein
MAVTTDGVGKFYNYQPWAAEAFDRENLQGPTIPYMRWSETDPDEFTYGIINHGKFWSSYNSEWYNGVIKFIHNDGLGDYRIAEKPMGDNGSYSNSRGHEVASYSGIQPNSNQGWSFSVDEWCALYDSSNNMIPGTGAITGKPVFDGIGWHATGGSWLPGYYAKDGSNNVTFEATPIVWINGNYMTAKADDTAGDTIYVQSLMRLVDEAGWTIEVIDENDAVVSLSTMTSEWDSNPYEDYIYRCSFDVQNSKLILKIDTGIVTSRNCNYNSNPGSAWWTPAAGTGKATYDSSFAPVAGNYSVQTFNSGHTVEDLMYQGLELNPDNYDLYATARLTVGDYGSGNEYTWSADRNNWSTNLKSGGWGNNSYYDVWTNQSKHHEKLHIMLDDATLSGHDVALSTTQDGTHNSGSEITNGVTMHGSVGNAGAYLELDFTTLAVGKYYLYCKNHSGMGGTGSIEKSA